MEHLLQSLLENSHGLWAYLSVFGVLVLCGLGVPLPEDLSLILGGLLAHKGAARLPIMIAVGFLGILCGDSMIYFAGRRLGTKVGRKAGGFFGRIVTPEKRAKVEKLFLKHGQKIVMIARFLPGVRAVTYFTAGSAGMPYLRFVTFDGLAALASAPLFVFLGYRFGNRLEQLIEKVKQGQLKVLIVLATLGVAYLVFTRIQKRRKAAESLAAPARATPGLAELQVSSVSSNRGPTSEKKPLRSARSDSDHRNSGHRWP